MSSFTLFRNSVSRVTKNKGVMKRPLRMEPLEERSAPSASLLGLVALSNLAGNSTTQIAAVPKTTDAVRTDLGVSLSLKLEPLESRTLDSIFSDWEPDWTESDEFQTSSSSTVTEIALVSLSSETLPTDEFTPLIEAILRGQTQNGTSFTYAIEFQVPSNMVSTHPSYIAAELGNGTISGGSASNLPSSFSGETHEEIVLMSNDTVFSSFVPTVTTESEQISQETMLFGTGALGSTIEEPHLSGSLGPAPPSAHFKITKVDVFLWADTPNHTYTFTTPDSFNLGSEISGVSGVGNFADVSVTSNSSGKYIIQSVSITTRGEVGYAQFTVSETFYGLESYVFNVYSMRMEGFEVEERAYDGDWDDVEDTGDAWRLGWQSNEYRWRPIMEDGVGADKMGSTTFRAINWSDRGSAQGTIFASGYRDTNGECWAYGTPPNGEYAVNMTMTPYCYTEPFPTPPPGAPRQTLYAHAYHLDPNVAAGWDHEEVRAASETYPRIGMEDVASIEWVTTDAITHQLTSPNHTADLGKLQAHGNGYRIFPEKSDPQVFPNNKVHAKVTLQTSIPEGMSGTVHLKVYDPDNPLVVDKNDTEANNQNRPGDNYGVLVTWTHTLTFDGSVTRRHESHDANTAKVQYYYGAISPAHAGDDYILAVHPNTGVVDKYEFKADGKTLQRPGVGIQKVDLDTKLRTKILTVWRTLNVECDQLVHNGVSAGVPSLAGIPTQQYARACIELKKFSQPANSVDIPLEYIHSPLSYSEMAITTNKRTIPQPTEDFWTVHLIGAFFEHDWSSSQLKTWGWTPHSSLSNTVFIYNKAIDILPITFELTPAQVSIFRERVIAHEIGHLMFVGHSEAPGIMASVDPSDQVLPAYRTFTPDDLKNFQAVTVPR